MREIIDFAASTDTFTVSPAFSGQILASVTYSILPQRSGETATAGLASLLVGTIGSATGNGSAGGTTIVDSSRTEADSFWVGDLVMICSGAYNGQKRKISAFANSTGTITVSPAFNGQILSGVQYVILPQNPNIASTEHESKIVGASSNNVVASAAATNLTAISLTVTFPAGATRIRALLSGVLKVVNGSAATHHIGAKMQGQKAAGGYTDQGTDLTGSNVLGLVNVDGSTDAAILTADVTALVTASDTYTFRFVVDSDNAGSVTYTSSFTLAIVYTM
jgi:hypothetical protein